MLTERTKYFFKVIFVAIVIAGLLASYIFTGVSPAPVPTANDISAEIEFVGPKTEPSVSNPATAPAVNGPQGF